MFWGLQPLKHTNMSTAQIQEISLNSILLSASSLSCLKLVKLQHLGLLGFIHKFPPSNHHPDGRLKIPVEAPRRVWPKHRLLGTLEAGGPDFQKSSNLVMFNKHHHLEEKKSDIIFESFIDI